MTSIAKVLAALGWAAFLAAAGTARAQEPAFPKKSPIEITVLFPAGSSADVTARLLADGMSRQLGTNVIVFNRPGAGGALGYRYVADKKPDGYSLVWNSNSISTTYYSGTLTFNYQAFDPVARVLVESPVLGVRSNSKWKTLADFVADAKARPGSITVANSGAGSHTHITAVALANAADIKVLDVPFGAAQVLTSLLGSQIDAVVQLPSALTEYVKAGQVRLLATLTANRDPAFPDVPTARELGYDVALDAWRGVAVPKGTPQAVVDTLETAIRNTVASPEFTQGCERLGAKPTFLSAADFGRLIAREDAYLSGIMGAIGLKKQQ